MSHPRRLSESATTRPELSDFDHSIVAWMPFVYVRNAAWLAYEHHERTGVLLMTASGVATVGVQPPRHARQLSGRAGSGRLHDRA